MTPLLVGDLGTPEMFIILAVIILVFGANKLPELARGSGRALRIFKAETKGLMSDDDTTSSSAAPVAPPVAPTAASPTVTPTPSSEQRPS